MFEQNNTPGLLLQRLVLDEEIGFNYDYMGNALFEHGSTGVGRKALAQTFIDGNLQSKFVTFIPVRNGVQGDAVKVAVLAHKDHIAEMGDMLTIATLSESARTDDNSIVGWMSVDFEHAVPLLMMRASLGDRGKRVEAFIQPFVDQINEATKEKS